MINWDIIYKDLGFKTEIQMWNTLLVSLRNSTAIANYLNMSKGAVQRRRQILNLHRPSRRGQTYRAASKRYVLDQIPPKVWQMPIEDIALYIGEEYDISISQSYISQYRRRRGL